MPIATRDITVTTATTVSGSSGLIPYNMLRRSRPRTNAAVFLYASEGCENLLADFTRSVDDWKR